MILSTDEEKAFGKIQHRFLIKNPQESQDRGTYLNIIKAIYEKLTANIILNGEKLTAFPVYSETQQACPFSSLLFYIALEVLATAENKKK